MTPHDTTPHYDVVVVGGGPTGAALAGDLGRRGRSVLLLEQYDGIVRRRPPAHGQHPHHGARPEVGHRRGPAQLRMATGPPQDVVWGPSLSEPEIARIKWPSIADMTPPATSPTFAQRCPQRWFNAILLRFADQQPSVTTRFHQQVTAVTDDDTLVTVTVLDTADVDPTDPERARSSTRSPRTTWWPATEHAATSAATSESGPRSRRCGAPRPRQSSAARSCAPCR